MPAYYNGTATPTVSTVYTRWIISRPSVMGSLYWPQNATNGTITSSAVTDTFTWAGNDAYATPTQTGDAWIIGGPTTWRRIRHSSEPERIYRPAVIRRRSVAEHAREVVREVTTRRETGDANRRALKLLMSHLTPVQRQTFIENGWFVVEGGRSKQRYRIRGKQYVANIDVLDGERVAHRLCGHCEPGLPISDQLLAQKIMLEIAEDDFLKLANRHAAA